MRFESESNFSVIRIKQIDELYKWGIKNTDLERISVNDAASFFLSDRENIPSNLVHVSKEFMKLQSHAIELFKIGIYSASEYAMAVILRRTKNSDIVKIFTELNKSDTLIQSPLSNSAKIKLLQKIISQMNEDQLISSEEVVTERLTQKEGITEIDAKECINKALKSGAIIKTKSGNLSL